MSLVALQGDAKSPYTRQMLLNDVFSDNVVRLMRGDIDDFYVFRGTWAEFKEEIP